MKYPHRQSMLDEFFRFEIVAVLLLLITVADATAQSITYISPLPGSQSVSRQSTIIVRSRGPLDPAVAADSRFFSVIGSMSGSHAGKTILSDDQRTLVFIPSVAFAAGEEVTVQTKPGQTTRDGTPLEPLTFSFSVTTLLSPEQEALLHNADSLSTRSGTNDVAQNTTAVFGTTTDNPLPEHFPAPVITISDDPAPGALFLISFHVNFIGSVPLFVPTDEQFLMILDNASDVVFSRPVGTMSTDLKVQPNGHLTYYDGVRKCFLELDNTYAVVDSFRAVNGFTTDVHDFVLLPNGHALILAQEGRFIDMRKIVEGGSWTAWVIGSAIQELDRNKNVVFQWRSLDYIPVTDATHENLKALQIDYIHSNALDVDTDGNILLCSRHLDEVTKIDRETGKIIWRLGGKGNQFTFTNDPIGFSHQHSARRTPAGTILLFDNGNFHAPRLSRAVEYAIDDSAKTATLVWEYRHAPDVYAPAMASVQRLENGNTLIGWGAASSPAVTEVRPDGSVALEMEFPDNIISYRAFRFPWKIPSSTTTAVRTEPAPHPSETGLHRNFPNPFNPSTLIRYTIPEQSFVSLRVYDVLGREVALLAESVMSAGTHSARFDASHLPAGVYVCALRAGNRIFTEKMILLK